MFLKLHILPWVILSTFLLESLLGFIALLGSLVAVDVLVFFMLVKGELLTVDFLLGHTGSVLTV